MKRRQLPALIAVLATSLAACGAAPDRAPTVAPSTTETNALTTGEAADDGARIIAVDEVGERLRDLTIESPSVGEVSVRLQLPPGFEAAPTERWPVLYLLHGAGGSSIQLSPFAADPTLSAADVLVVMPDGGTAGFYSDWWNGGGGGPPRWETFHLVELRELLERNWRAGDRRAVAGVSMGGYGAIEYAARRPGYFLAAASYSGPLAPSSDPETFLQVLRSIGAAGSDDLWGDPVAQAEVWRAHDPAVNAAGLTDTALFVSFGSGEPGPLDPSDATFDELEAFVATQGKTFVDRLTEVQIPATVDAYGPGTHDGAYFLREFERSLPILLEALAE